MIKLNKLKSLTTFKLFSEIECERIIKSIDINKVVYNKFVEVPNFIVDAHCINVNDLNEDIKDLIYSRITKLSDNEILTCFILRYSEDTLPSMQPHYDLCKQTVVISLNKDFKGGETNFPFRFFKFKPQEQENGTALFFKGHGFLSWHEALPVKDGVKYSLNVKYGRINSGGILKSILLVFKIIPVYYIYKKLFKYERK